MTLLRSERKRYPERSAIGSVMSAFSNRCSITSCTTSSASLSAVSSIRERTYATSRFHSWAMRPASLFFCVSALTFSMTNGRPFYCIQKPAQNGLQGSGGGDVRPVIGAGQGHELRAGKVPPHHFVILRPHVVRLSCCHEERLPFIDSRYRRPVRRDRVLFKGVDVRFPTEAFACGADVPGGFASGIRHQELARAQVGDQGEEKLFELRTGAAAADVRLQRPKLPSVLRGIRPRSDVDRGDTC